MAWSNKKIFDLMNQRGSSIRGRYASQQGGPSQPPTPQMGESAGGIGIGGRGGQMTKFSPGTGQGTGYDPGGGIDTDPGQYGWDQPEEYDEFIADPSFNCPSGTVWNPDTQQ